MTTWFITRHAGAVAWANKQGVQVDRVMDHLDPFAVSPGDIVIGTLPVHLAAAVCERGGRYLHLRLDLPAEARGVELSADDMRGYGARLEAYRVEQVK